MYGTIIMQSLNKVIKTVGVTLITQTRHPKSVAGGQTDGRTYLQDGHSEVPNCNFRLQIFGSTPQAFFITPSYPNLT